MQPGRAPHEPVKVPFILLPETQNEGQFAFTIEQISMPQKLKGTLTYFMKVSASGGGGGTGKNRQDRP